MSTRPRLHKQLQEGRLFIAVPLPQQMALALAKSCRQLETSLPGRYVPLENYHVTLAFIGNAPLSLAQDLKPMFRSAAAQTPPIPTKFSEYGYFGSSHSAILWAGLTAGDALLPLARVIRAGLKGRHISYDRKPVRPHITVARKVNLSETTLPSPPAAQGDMDRLVLYHSTRRNGNLVYLPILTVPFAG